MSNPLRKTMVYLGLADEEFDYDENTHAMAAPVAAAPQDATATRAPVTPLRRAPQGRAMPSRAAAPADLNEILTVHPRQYKDAQAIAESFREGIPVIINLSQMSEPEARRLIDFASGLSQGLYGKIERVTSKVFLLSPSHVAVSGDEAEPETGVDASFFAQA
ncbi:MAG: cell division protein SepF [Cryobacterium sp.]|nr:cell division protein SepF [Cryobacterium sp.]